jgi:hypothetical protein
MTQVSYPFAKSLLLTDEQWSKIARHWVGTGVLSDLLVFADSTGMQIKVNRGYAFIKGHYYESDQEMVLPISAANATNPRIDRVVISLDWSLGLAQLAVLQGVPAASPVAPAVTQNTAKWEIPLAQVRVDAGVTTVALAKITDERYFVRNANITQEAWKDLTLINGWVNYGGVQATAQYMKDELGFVHIKGLIKGGITSAGDWICAALPVGYRPKEELMFSCATANGSTVTGDANLVLQTTGAIVMGPNVSNTYLNLSDIKPFRAEG